MHPKSILIPLMAIALAAPAGAQQPAAAPTKADATFQALSPLVAPRVAELHAAGVQKIVARTGKGRRDIQVLTRWGTTYLPWPKDVKPAEFDLLVEAPTVIDLTAPGYTDATKATYAAAFDAVLPRALRVANEARVAAMRPKP